MESRAEVEPVRHHLGTCTTFMAVDALKAEGKFELFHQGQVRKESGRLCDPPTGALLGRETGDVGVIKKDPTGIGEFEAGDEAEGGGLAAAGGTDKEVMRARGDVDGEVLHRLDGAEVFADSLESDARHDGERFKVSDSSLKCVERQMPRHAKPPEAGDERAHWFAASRFRDVSVIHNGPTSEAPSRSVPWGRPDKPGGVGC